MVIVKRITNGPLREAGIIQWPASTRIPEFTTIPENSATTIFPVFGSVSVLSCPIKVRIFH